MSSVLYVDDEMPMRQAVKIWLERSGHQVATAADVSAARALFEDHRFDVAFVDIWLPDGTGFELFAWLEDNEPALAKRTIFVTGDIVPNVELRATLETLGRPVLAKPFDLEELDRYVRRYTERRAADAPQANAS